MFYRSGYFESACDRPISNRIEIDSLLSESLPEQNVQTSQIDQTTTASTNIDQDVTDNSNLDNYFLSYEELIDVLPAVGDTAMSAYMQTNDANIDTIKNNLKRQLVSELTAFSIRIIYVYMRHNLKIAALRYRVF